MEKIRKNELSTYNPKTHYLIPKHVNFIARLKSMFSHLTLVIIIVIIIAMLFNLMLTIGTYANYGKCKIFHGLRFDKDKGPIGTCYFNTLPMNSKTKTFINISGLIITR